MSRLSLGIALLVGAWLVGAAWTPGWAKDPGTVPTKIVSDRMEYAPDNSAVVFSGNVQVDRNDVRLTADKITVLFAPTKGGGGQTDSLTDTGRLEKILAQGNVRIQQEAKVATCQTATYLIREGLIRLEGDPLLQEGKNNIRGSVIKLFIKDKRSEIVGGEKSRVEATFFTPADMDLTK